MSLSDFDPSQAKRDTLLKHIATVWEIFHCDFLTSSAIPVATAEKVQLSADQLAEAIGHALEDMERMANLHLRDVPKQERVPDRHKYSGFLAKWIAKIRPLHFPDDVVHSPASLSVNAAFAAYVFQSFLTSKIPADMRDHLVYALHFRDERGEILAEFAYCYETMGKEAEMAAAKPTEG